MVQSSVVPVDFLKETIVNEKSLPSREFTLANGVTGKIIDTGVIVFEPSCETDTDLVISSAIHGNETAPIEIVNGFINDILEGQLTLAQRVLFIFGNPPAINIGQRFVDYNLNRLFSGTHGLNEQDIFSLSPTDAITAEHIRAAKLERYVAEFFESQPNGRKRIHYDLHTAIRDSKREKFAVYPFLFGEPWSKEVLEFLHRSEVDTVMLMHEPATTFAFYSSSKMNALALTIELGKVYPFGENDLTRMQAIRDNIECLLSAKEWRKEDFDVSLVDTYVVHQSINRETEAFELNFDDDVKNFTDFPKGYVLATDDGKEHCIDQDGELIVFPNANVQLGHRAILTIVPLDITRKVV